MARRVAMAGAMIAVIGLVWGLLVVLGRERNELDWHSAPKSIADARDGVLVLGEVQLSRGDDVLFDVCADDALAAPRWTGAADAVVWVPGMVGRADDDAIAIRVPFDTAALAQARRTSHEACLEVGHAERLADDGVFAVGLLVHDRAPRARFVAHVLAHRPLAGGGAPPFLTLLAGSFLLALSLSLRTRDAAVGDAPRDVPRGRALLRVAIGVSVFVLAILLTAGNPLGGATVALVVATLLVVVELVAASQLVPRAEGESRGEALGLVGARKWRVAVALAAPLAGVLLFVVARIVANAIDGAFPQHGESAIEAFVAWPSARLAVVMVAALAPVAEEVFFRGFLYGALDKARGTAVAFPVTVLLFAAAHLPQIWGDPGAIVSMLLVSLALTTVRATTGSTAASALVHVAHNAVVALLTVMASS